ncbi:hypothetical protein IEQ34_003015 [Dendrobium chrysotoxum]|uniref:Uncharacterized protein n=1 Tax=Dendrobium chrysotoxum TaxID=161865 RepID=A0AAV7HGD6_DENCH|nr:hypothetical protein IEQ34_003015 [Dendrobium chrysotoxum]
MVSFETLCSLSSSAAASQSIMPRRQNFLSSVVAFEGQQRCNAAVVTSQGHDLLVKRRDCSLSKRPTSTSTTVGVISDGGILETLVSKNRELKPNSTIRSWQKFVDDDDDCWWSTALSLFHQLHTFAFARSVTLLLRTLPLLFEEQQIISGAYGMTV